MVTIQQSLSEAKYALGKVTDLAGLEAEILLASVLGKPRAFLYAWPAISLSDTQAKQFASFVQRRCNKEPVSYITGWREFWSLALVITPDTLIPRPETERLVEATLACYPEAIPRKIADLGTGSGAVGLALAHEKPGWHIHATDISKPALAVAKKNAKRLGIENVSFFHGDWCHPLPYSDFDAIVSNPPYLAEAEWDEYAGNLAFEPRQALVSGEDGLEAIRQISQAAKHYLKPNGYIIIEHGFSQAKAVQGIFHRDGYKHIDSIRDLAGHERITMGRHAGYS